MHNSGILLNFSFLIFILQTSVIFETQNQIFHVLIAFFSFFFKESFFASRAGFPLYPEIFFIIQNDPAAHQDHGDAGVEPLPPKSNALLISHHTSPMDHHISPMSHHISPMSHHISAMSHHISAMSHHISNSLSDLIQYVESCKNQMMSKFAKISNCS